jgi:hypothetical protein
MYHRGDSGQPPVETGDVVLIRDGVEGKVGGIADHDAERCPHLNPV